MNGTIEVINTFVGKDLPYRHLPGPERVRSRNSNNMLIMGNFGWLLTVRLGDGLRMTSSWIRHQLEKACLRT